MKKQTMKKTILGLSLAAVLGLGGTFAYLTATTGEKVNNFTSDNNVTGRTDEVFEEQKASNYQPGDLIKKAPTVSIDAGSESAWVGLKVEYIDSKGNALPYDKFSKVASIEDLNKGTGETQWTKSDTAHGNAEFYIYNTALTGGTKATPLFTQTKVNAGITTLSSEKTKTVYTYDAQGNLVKTEKSDVSKGTTVYDADGNVLGEFKEFNADTGALTTKLPSFTIKITGYAVQSKNVDKTAALTELEKLAF